MVSAACAAACLLLPVAASAATYMGKVTTGADADWFTPYIPEDLTVPGAYRFTLAFDRPVLSAEVFGIEYRTQQYYYHDTGEFAFTRIADPNVEIIPAKASFEPRSAVFKLPALLYHIQPDVDFTYDVFESYVVKYLYLDFRVAPQQTIAWRVSIDAIPEPATWALMIAGFGLAGSSLRRRYGVANEALAATTDQLSAASTCTA
jgi:hypothetical protein